jgi:hypothetical protein
MCAPALHPWISASWSEFDRQKSRIASVAFTRRDLSEFDIVYLFVDGMPSGCGPAARASQSSPPTMSASCTSYHRAAVTALCMRK